MSAKHDLRIMAMLVLYQAKLMLTRNPYKQLVGTGR